MSHKADLQLVLTQGCVGATATVFLFSGAHHAFFTEQVGAVFAVFNGKVRPASTCLMITIAPVKAHSASRKINALQMPPNSIAAQFKQL